MFSSLESVPRMEKDEKRFISILVLALLLLLIPGAECRIIEVTWSRSNPLLRLPHPVLVNEDHGGGGVSEGVLGYDQAHFICPENDSSEFSVFSVPIDEYNACALLKPKSRYMYPVHFKNLFFLIFSIYLCNVVELRYVKLLIRLS